MKDEKEKNGLTNENGMKIGRNERRKVWLRIGIDLRRKGNNRNKKEIGLEQE